MVSRSFSRFQINLKVVDAKKLPQSINKHLSHLLISKFTGLAQLVERTTFNRVVMGSIPISGAKFTKVNSFLFAPTFLIFLLLDDVP
jgi:hypothetical protein